jgi:phenylacetate-CoA ligase
MDIGNRDFEYVRRMNSLERHYDGVPDPPWLKKMFMLGRASIEGRLARRLPFKSREQIERARDARLRRLVRYAYRTVPFYRETMDGLGVSPSGIRGLGDMSRLPIVGDDEMRGRGEDLLSSALKPHQLYQFFTGGSTGVVKPVYYDARSLIRNAAFGNREKDVYARFLSSGRNLRVLYIVPTVTTSTKIHELYRRLIPGYRSLGPTRGLIETQAPFQEKVKAINSFKPDILVGFSKSCGEFFFQVRKRGTPIHLPKLAILGTESLPQTYRKIMEDELGVPAIVIYSSCEAMKLGFECERHCGLHIHEDIAPVRVVDEDGMDVKPGDEGMVLISNTVNHATVLLNFDLNDRGRLIEEPCGCGRNFHRIELTESRNTPLMETPDGRKLNYVEVVGRARAHNDVAQYQIVIESPVHWRVLLVSSDPERTRTWLGAVAERANREVGAPGLRIEYEMTDAPLKTAGGKTPIVIRREQVGIE